MENSYFINIVNYDLVSPLKYKEEGNGGVAGTLNNQRTLYVPAGIAAPEVTTTLVPDNVGSGIPLSIIEVLHAVDIPTSTVILVIVPPTPTNGIQTV
jgi:hypothetical protein